MTMREFEVARAGLLPDSIFRQLARDMPERTDSPEAVAAVTARLRR